MNHRTAKRAKPVFVDRSGRRRRLITIVGACVGGLLLTAVVVAWLTSAVWLFSEVGIRS